MSAALVVFCSLLGLFPFGGLLEWCAVGCWGGVLGGVVAFAVGAAFVVAVFVVAAFVCSALVVAIFITIAIISALVGGVLLFAGIGKALDSIGVFQRHITKLLTTPEGLPTGDVLVFVGTDDVFLRLGWQDQTA